MPLDQRWYSNASNAPFRTNSDGAITAATLREFAEEVATEVASDDWAEYSPGPANLGDPYVWDETSTSEVLWFPVDGSGQVTDNWEYGENARGEAYLTYTTGLRALVAVTLSAGEGLFVDGVTVGTTVTPVMFAGDPALPDDYTVMGSSVEITESPTTLRPSGSSQLLLPAASTSVMAGLLFTPPTGSSIEASGGTFEVDDTAELSLLVVARPVKTPSNINTA
jgi:hypothetical protein